MITIKKMTMKETVEFQTLLEVQEISRILVDKGIISNEEYEMRIKKRVDLFDLDEENKKQIVEHFSTYTK